MVTISEFLVCLETKFMTLNNSCHLLQDAHTGRAALGPRFNECDDAPFGKIRNDLSVRSGRQKPSELYRVHRRSPASIHTRKLFKCCGEKVDSAAVQSGAGMCMKVKHGGAEAVRKLTVWKEREKERESARLSAESKRTNRQVGKAPGRSRNARVKKPSGNGRQALSCTYPDLHTLIYHARLAKIEGGHFALAAQRNRFFGARALPLSVARAEKSLEARGGLLEVLLEELKAM
eukprot:2739507-Pleurochrysis_carterae.AAC.1